MKHRYIDKSLRRLRRRRDDPEKTRAYAPRELQHLAHEQKNGAGVIRPDTGDLNLPTGIDAFGEGEQTDHPARVVIIIVILSLIWIAIITFFVAHMPDSKDNPDRQAQTERGR